MSNLPTESNRHADALVRMIELSMPVRRRYQFFVWAQTYFGTLLPHQLLVCGAYQRTRKELVFEPFHSIVVPPVGLTALCDPGSVLMQQVVGAWIDGGGAAVTVDLGRAGAAADAEDRAALVGCGLRHLLVHGVARPGRPAELETLFILAAQDRSWDEEPRESLERLLPHLHATYLRMQATEREMRGIPSTTPTARPGERRALITERERQILTWVREGKSNLEIGIVLDISALTVKNHVQKILRKLGAANRAQAVAKAMSLNLLGRGAPEMLSTADEAGGAAS